MSCSALMVAPLGPMMAPRHFVKTKMTRFSRGLFPPPPPPPAPTRRPFPAAAAPPPEAPTLLLLAAVLGLPLPGPRALGTAPPVRPPPEEAGELAVGGVVVPPLAAAICCWLGEVFFGRFLCTVGGDD